MGLGGPERRYLHMAVNLLGVTVSSEQPTQNSHPPHPGHLLGHSSVGSALSLTYEQGESGSLQRSWVTRAS